MSLLLVVLTIVIFAYTLLCSVLFVEFCIKAFNGNRSLNSKPLILFEDPHLWQYSEAGYGEDAALLIRNEEGVPCNAYTLHPCSLTDVRTVQMCREMSAVCKHFPEDTEYHESNQKVKIIPKNSSPNEGYALPMRAANEKCNLYHGKLVLMPVLNEFNVKNINGIKQYMLLCVCLQPGFVRNNSLLGNCTNDKSLCNGMSLVNINTPLSSAKCNCRPLEVSTYDAIGRFPRCRAMTVLEANTEYSKPEYTDKYWTDLVKWSSSRTLNIKHFDSYVSANVNTKYLLNPCENSLLDARVAIPYGRFNAELKSCYVLDQGIPVRINLLEKPYSKSENEDKSKPDSVDAVLPSQVYRKLRVTDRVTTKCRRLVNVHTKMDCIPNVDSDEDIFVNLPENIGVGIDVQVGITLMNPSIPLLDRPFTMVAVLPDCDTDTDRQTILTPFTSNKFYYKCILSKGPAFLSRGIPVQAYKPPFGRLWWGTKAWEDASAMWAYGVSVDKYGLSISPKYFNARKEWQNYGIALVHYKHMKSEGLSGPLFMQDKNAYATHRDQLQMV